jgi:propanol-preferring alcohol dehydrogenase
MTTYHAFQVTGRREFRPVDLEPEEPRPGHVRLKVEACGVCHSDVLAVEGLRADPNVPIVPGHEIAGVIDAVGAGVTTWAIGDRVGVGFFNGHCGECDPCRRGDFVNCRHQEQTGTTMDGGYGQVAYARASGVARVPDGMEATDAAPLLCAGITAYKALLQADARPGALVAVQGIGGVGHLALQYAAALGYRVVAIGRGSDKAAEATRLGAEMYVDSTATDPGAALQYLGGAAAVVATAASGAAMSPLVAGLAARGRLVVVGVGRDPLELKTPELIFGTRTVLGTVTGSAIENEDNLRFAQRHGIGSINEVVPLQEAPKAYERMFTGQAHFRMVLDTRT